MIPSHLPRFLTISLWDFSWYTQTMPGEPFDDLDRAFAEAVERGYNTVRICALPYLLFGPGSEERGLLHIRNLGGAFGQRTRWYNVRGGAILDGRAHLLKLFRAARRHNCYVILSSWEYQQSPAFLASPDMLNRLLAVPPAQRFVALAEAMGQLIEFLKENNLADRIAYAELHNEIDTSAKLCEIVSADTDIFAAQKPYIEEAVAMLRARHPDILTTVSYVFPTIYKMRYLAENLQVGHFHLYVYAMLRDLYEALGLGSTEGPIASEVTQAILRPDAPPFDEWRPAQGHEWQLDGTQVTRWSFYVYDWADPDAWDLWLYKHYHSSREVMRQTIRQRIESFADWAGQQAIPAVIGEGYVGYTPLLAGFEDGPVGKEIAEYAIETCRHHNFWGYVLCSNSAPHHPFWRDVAWQQNWNRRILQGS